MTGIEFAIIGLLMWGSYEHGQDSVKVPPCPQKTLVTLECPDIYPPEGPSFGETTRSYSSLITQYRTCQKACQPAQ